MDKLESIEILKKKIEFRIAQLKYEDAHIDRKKELYRVLKIFIPESIRGAKDAEAAELLRKCEFSKDIKDAPVHGDKYLIHDKTNEKELNK